jgi:hypothetical protein
VLHPVHVFGESVHLVQFGSHGLQVYLESL